MRKSSSFVEGQIKKTPRQMNSGKVTTINNENVKVIKPQSLLPAQMINKDNKANANPEEKLQNQ